MSKSRKPNTKVIKKSTFGGHQIIIHGSTRHFWEDLYHLCLSITWVTFFSSVILSFVSLNVVFALLYMIEPAGIMNLYPNNILGAFFFSVETLSTVGYGDMHPISVYTHLIATVEMFVGLSGSAVLTGLIFARFSKPRARILFAKSPVVTLLNGKSMLMTRVANARQNFIVDATAKLSMLYIETTTEGNRFRRVVDLKLVRNNQPMFFMGWTIMHIIDDTSPLFGLNASDAKRMGMSFVLIINGTDESTTQHMQARKIYENINIKWQHRFVDAIYIDENGVSNIDYNLFHDTEAI